MSSISYEEKVGAKVSLTILLLGIAALILIWAVITGGGIQYLMFFLFDYSLVVLLIGTIFWGSRAGVKIIRKNRNDDWTGIKTAFLIFLTFAAARIPLDMDVKNAFSDTQAFKNFLAGILWIIGWMAMPAIVYGILIGRTIKKYVR